VRGAARRPRERQALDARCQGATRELITRGSPRAGARAVDRGRSLDRSIERGRSIGVTSSRVGRRFDAREGGGVM